MGMIEQDLPVLVYEGPPRWDGSKWVDGDRFTLSGGKGVQLDLGVELAPGVAGLESPPKEYRYNTSADVPGSSFVSAVAGGREISASINILADTPRELRDNKRRWFRNHPESEMGRLWAMTKEGEPRFIPVLKSETAGTNSLEKDPNIRKLYEGFEWGWVSDQAYWQGYKVTAEFVPNGTQWTADFYNPSTAPRVYFTLFLPGGCKWKFNLGDGSTFTTITIETGHIARLDYNPKNRTFLKKAPDGSIENMWYSLFGHRPDMFMEPETSNSLTIEAIDGTPDSPPKIEFTPLFESWV